ncbi:MAG TPA: IS5/IS1182 family transposase, partial [Desulfobacterales bacterium]|nr:IS5/IS1182 family transposase [Desulfobacterales bacterium]
CKELDLYGAEVVAIDGSKFKAVNSKKRNFNEDKLIKKLKDIEEKIEAYLQELEKNDNEESSISQPDVKEIRDFLFSSG